MKLRVYAMGILLFFLPKVSFGYCVNFIDDNNNKIIINSIPKRIVSINPSITEILCEIGAKEYIKGITYYDRCLIKGATIVGGFLSPSIQKIKSISPDIIFYSKINKDILLDFKKSQAKMVMLNPEDLPSLYRTIKILSKIVNRESQGDKLIKNIKDDLSHIEKKTQHIPTKDRVRVIRIMGRNYVMTPGIGSFQNILISKAGAIPPKFQGQGKVVRVRKKDWIRFNPQVIYGCYGDKKIIEKIKKLPGWNEVDAIKNKKIFIYPCELTCRLSAHTGYFVSWLSSDIYRDEFLDKKYWEYKDHVISRKKLNIDLSYVKKVELIHSYLFDFKNKTLLITFNKPMDIISSLEGPRKNILYIGNHYTPPPCWGITHELGLNKSRKEIYHALSLNKKNTSMLFTGANMDNLCLAKKRYKKIAVYVFATAGVESNAMRMSRDTGSYYEPGTINIIIMTNVILTPRAMTRAIITATEAKSAVLNDLDIRSSYNPNKYQATGTGTDNIIVVQGDGKYRIDNAGGHSKLGELISKSVYEAVLNAIKKQNKIVKNRNIIKRLSERGISLYDIVYNNNIIVDYKKKLVLQKLEDILINPKYASFMDSILALSDEYEKGRLKDLFPIKMWGKEIASSICKKENIEIIPYVTTQHIPEIIKIGLNSLLSGIENSV